VKRALAALVLLGVVLAAGVQRSGATFTAAAANPAAVFASAADFNTVAVALSDPGAALRGTVALTVTATSDRGIQSVAFQRSPSGSDSWATVCTLTAAPFTCTLDTGAVGDGVYDLRVVAIDAAGYTRTSRVDARRFDNTGPATTLADPGSTLTGGVSLNATSSDAGSGLASVALELRSASGGAWTTVCTRAASPASCTWDTTLLADGLYDLRAHATDALGNVASSTVTDRLVDNTPPSITISDPGTPLRDTVTLQSTTGDGAGSGVATVRYEYKPSASSSWSAACSATAAPFSCAWITGSLPDGTYDVRAVATDGVNRSTASGVLGAHAIDNTAPSSAVLADPGSPLSSTTALSAAAADAGALASVRFERSPAGAANWTAICTDATGPYTCDFDTAAVADGVYDLRVVATDTAGNALSSAVVANRRVDNNGPTVALSDPGSPLRGVAALAATASDPAGVQSVAFASKPTGGSTWTTICTDASSPYGCTWTSTSVADGSYDLRAVATDVYGHQTTSLVTSQTVDNTAPRAIDVQGRNGGTTKRLDAGDYLTFIWSETIKPTSILSGWTGSSSAVTVRVSNSGSKDLIEIWNAANSTRLAITSATQALQLQQNWVSTSSVFAATMAQSGSTVTITLGALISGTIRTNVNGTTAVTWTPSIAATDLAGNPCQATSVNETGGADVDF
jgi:chitinase